MHNIDAVIYPGVQLSWRRVISIAQNTPDPAAIDNKLEDEVNDNPTSRIQCMGRALQNMYTITSQEEGYVAFISTMLQELKYNCPVSMTFVKHIIDFSEIPSKQTIQRATDLLFRVTAENERINQSILWSMLARKFAGNLAEAMWRDEIATVLIQSLLDKDKDRMVKIFALLALESFALTGSIKKRIVNHPLGLVLVLNQNLQECYSLLSESPMINSPNLTLVSALRRKYTGKKFYHDLIKKLKIKKSKKPVVNPPPTLPNTMSYDWSGLMQSQHCFLWSLHNIFNPSSSVPSIPLPKVFLNPKDCTSHCKLSENCLEIRNDTFYLESARATASVDSGVWYYEVLLLTNGVMQIGWGTKKCVFLQEEGCGVGDDPNGFAFDTYRSAIWAASEAIYPRTRRNIGHCKTGDVLGSLLDMDKGLCTFFVNGQDLGLTVQFQTSAKKHMLGLFPIISLTSHQHVIVNFGEQPWLYQPNIRHQPMCNSSQHVMDLVKKEEEEEYDWDGPLCTLCFSEPKDVVLFPCQHNGFGKNCAKVLEHCPLCRTKIDERVTVCKT
ncbi:concanavalin A-like lectin/glucanase domain-containing protein [Helicostylum pulchrum]|nr:concanavalin A-like lectin/glucanase domain-containing protein [Helicostylum pulchrum]